jgi:hypothetical protein
MKIARAYLLLSMLLSAVAFAASPIGNYRGMLGTYGAKTFSYPFYLLAIPNGTNVWSETAMAKLNGKVDMNQKPQEFSAIGSIYLPRKTKVKIEAGRAVTVTVDGKGYELSNYQKRNGVEVELQAGLHKVKLTVGNNGGQLKECGIWITENSVEVPIFITKTEMNQFVAQYKKEADELSGWDVKKALIEATK